MPGGAGQPLQPDAAVGPPAPALADAGDEGVSVKLAAVVRRVTARQLLQPAPDRAQLDRTFAAFRQEVLACYSYFRARPACMHPSQAAELSLVVRSLDVRVAGQPRPVSSANGCVDRLHTLLAVQGGGLHGTAGAHGRRRARR